MSGEQRFKILLWSSAIAVSNGSLRFLCESVLASGGAGWLMTTAEEWGSRELDPGVSLSGAGSSTAPFCPAIHGASGAAPARNSKGHRKPQ